MGIITLMTDFGLEDPYVGVLHGVIYNINSDVRLVDLSHSVQPQKVSQAAFLLGSVYRYFPASTVHVAVVDPGVGTERRAIGLRIGEVGTFVGPDNGLFSHIVAQETGRGANIVAYELTNPAFRLAQISATFHGRDIFAPAAAHLARGVPLEQFGQAVPLEGLVRLDTTIPQWEGKQGGRVKRLKGQVVHIDHFGNLITDLPASLFAELTPNQKQKLKVKHSSSITITGLRSTYGEKLPPAKMMTLNLINLISSSGYLEIACVNGSAAEILAAKIGNKVTVRVAPDIRGKG